MGRGATATLERMAASVGLLAEVEPRFERAADLPHGGVLLALPALLVSGLLSHTNKYFSLPAGFYGLNGASFFRSGQAADFAYICHGKGANM